MSTVEHFDARITARPNRGAAIDASDDKDNVIALRRSAAGSSFLWEMQLLPVQRREAMRALYAFCREVGDIADGEASRSLKQALLLNWRSEIAHLFAGRPQHDVTRGLSEAIHLYGLRCDDFLGIIDGMEMDARRDIRAPSIAELDRYCERVAVAVGRLSVRIFGEATPAGERVAAELGRALQLTNILRDLAEDAGRHRLYLPREMLHARGIFATTPNWVLAQPALAEVCNDPAPIVPRPVVAAPPAEPATAHLDQEKVPSAPAAEMMTPTPEPRMATSRAQHKSSRAVRKPHVSHVRRGPLSLRPGVLTPPPTTWHGGGY